MFLFMNTKIKWLVFWIWLSVFPNNIDSPKNLNEEVYSTEDRVEIIINNQEQVLLNELIIKYKDKFSQEELWKIQILINDENFKNELYKILKNEVSWSKKNLILSIILWFIYGFAYYKTIKKVRDDKMPIDITSFSIFSLTSWWMVIINWFVPWSVVYAESFMLAWYAVYLHIKNEKNKNN